MAQKRKKPSALIADFRGDAQAVRDIATIAPTLAAVASVKVTSANGGELHLAAGYTYDQVEQALHQHWPDRY